MTCAKCKEDKSIEEFHKNSRRPSGYQSYCKGCRVNIDKQWHKKRWDSGIKQEKQKILKDRNRNFVNNYLKDKCCVHCGNSDRRVLEFDHLDPKTKKYNVSEVTRGYSLDSIKEEIAKCQILCANCHRIKTKESYSPGIA